MLLQGWMEGWWLEHVFKFRWTRVTFWTTDKGLWTTFAKHERIVLYELFSCCKRMTSYKILLYSFILKSGRQLQMWGRQCQRRLYYFIDMEWFWAWCSRFRAKRTTMSCGSVHRSLGCARFIISLKDFYQIWRSTKADADIMGWAGILHFVHNPARKPYLILVACRNSENEGHVTNCLCQNT
jgi:hypothetical protein